MSRPIISKNSDFRLEDLRPLGDGARDAYERDLTHVEEAELLDLGIGTIPDFPGEEDEP